MSEEGLRFQDYAFDDRVKRQTSWSNNLARRPDLFGFDTNKLRILIEVAVRKAALALISV